MRVEVEWAMKLQELLTLLLLFTLTLPTRAETASREWIPLGSLDYWHSQVLEQLHRKVLILGELHGTVEAPRAALGLASSLQASGQDVVVAIEWPKSFQEDLDKNDLENLRRRSLFRHPDGRSSEAMVGLVQQCRIRGIAVRCIDAVAQNADSRDRGMAKNVLSIQEEFPQATLVVLVGNFHSRLEPPKGMPDYPPSMAMRLIEAGASVFSMSVSAGTGGAWNFTDEGRGVHPYKGVVVDELSASSGFRPVGEGQGRIHVREFHPSFPWRAESQDNLELAQIFADDQAARMAETIDWKVVSVQDHQRRDRVQAMLDRGEIQSGQDFYHAAFIFQHGSEAKDFLLAHILSSRAMQKGHSKAAWISAATLDRYLQNIGQPQVFGTQYVHRLGVWSQGEFDPTVISEALRSEFGVISLPEQKKRLENFRKSQ